MMSLASAMKTLGEMVGLVVPNRPSDEPGPEGPFRVIRIDYFADPYLRCVVNRIHANGSRHVRRCPVSRISTDYGFTKAEAVLSAATADDVRRELERLSGST